MRDSAERVALGEAAKRRALSDFGVRAMADAYERLYHGRDVAPRVANPTQPASEAVTS
jgi:hypothetical protein